MTLFKKKQHFYQLAYKILDIYLELYFDEIQNSSYHFQVMMVGV